MSQIESVSVHVDTQKSHFAEKKVWLECFQVAVVHRPLLPFLELADLQRRMNSDHSPESGALRWVRNIDRDVCVF